MFRDFHRPSSRFYFLGFLLGISFLCSGQSTSVNVPGKSNIALAGQPDGASFWPGDSAPPNSPVSVAVTLREGQVLRFSASGSVNLDGKSVPQIAPEGDSGNVAATKRIFGMSSIRGPAGSLIGVFLGPDKPSNNEQPPDLDFGTGARDLPVLSPLLQQPFFVGTGTTRAGGPRRIVIPRGAVRVFLAVLEDGERPSADNVGSFAVTMTLSDEAIPPLYPVVPAVTNIALAGEPPGATFWPGDSSPLNSPVQVPLAVAAGQVLRFSASGTVDLDGKSVPQTSPDGDSSLVAATKRIFGFSSVSARAGALIGVFIAGDHAAHNETPPDVDFTGAALDLAIISPLLQQPFYIGTGKTRAGAARNVVVPPGATRLYLAVLESGERRSGDNTGAFTVAAEIVTTPLPSIYPAIPAISNIALAGQRPGNTFWPGDSVPLNSPIQVAMAVCDGAVLQFSATGNIDLDGRSVPQTGPDGDTTTMASSKRILGIASLTGPAGALIGVFVGSDVPDRESTPPDVDFTGAARDLATLRPTLQQPFYIGKGATRAGAPRNVIAPVGSARLYVAVLESGERRSGDNTGAFTVTVNEAFNAPPTIYPSVPSISNIALAGQSDGANFWPGDSATLNSPVLFPASLQSGQRIQITATGYVNVDGKPVPQTTADGDPTRMAGTKRISGFSSVKGPSGALIGVFIGDDRPDPRATPPDLDFSGNDRNAATVAPLLQQPFYIGSGTTSAGASRAITVPANATRLFLGVLEDGERRSGDNTGAFTVTIPGGVVSVPTISSISPDKPFATIGNQQVTVNGKNFETGLNVIVRYPGGSAILSGAQIQNVTPESFVMLIDFSGVAATYTIRVKTRTGALSNEFPFSTDVPPSPQVTSISPGIPQASVGDQLVRVAGTNFRAGLTVTAGFPGGGFAVLSGPQILDVTPTDFAMLINFNGAAGPWTIRVNNPEGRKSPTFLFQVSRPSETESSGSITVDPNPCIIRPTESKCSVILRWATRNVAASQVWVRDALNTELHLFDGTLGSRTLSWIEPLPQRYDFRLYDYSSGARGTLLASAALTADTESGGSPDRATLVDENPKDNAAFTPMALFTKSWTLRNDGSTTWSTGYQLLYRSGNAGGDHTPVPVSRAVAPGETYSFQVPVTAPLIAGVHTESWQLVGASGTAVSIGQSAVLTIVIRVSPEQAPSDTGNIVVSVNWPVPGLVLSGPKTLRAETDAQMSNSGAEILYTFQGVAPGSYSVNYDRVSGYITPPHTSVEAVAGATVFVKGVYRRLFVVLFTGFGNPEGTASGMRELAAKLERDPNLAGILTRVFTYDEATGYSTWGSIRSTHEAAQRWLIDENNISNDDWLVVVGHSYGGNRGLLFVDQMAAKGARADGLVTVDPIDWVECNIADVVQCATSPFCILTIASNLASCDMSDVSRASPVGLNGNSSQVPKIDFVQRATGNVVKGYRVSGFSPSATVVDPGRDFSHPWRLPYDAHMAIDDMADVHEAIQQSLDDLVTRGAKWSPR